MSPEDVPAEWVEKALSTRLPSGGLPTLNEPQMRAILAAVLPLAQAAALEEASVGVLLLGTVSGSGVDVGRRAASWLNSRAARLREGSGGEG